MFSRPHISLMKEILLSISVIRIVPAVMQSDKLVRSGTLGSWTETEPESTVWKPGDIIIQMLQQPSGPQDYRKDYDTLYKNGYHGDGSYTLEGPVIATLGDLAKTLPAGSPNIGSVLVLGCSHGLGVKMLHDAGYDAYGVDVADQAIEVAKQTRGKTCNVEPCFQQASLTKLPQTDASVDAGMSSDVLEHIAPEDVPQVVHEISRVVRHYLVLSISSHYEWNKNGEKILGKGLHLTVKDSAWWSQQFSAAGWTVVKDTSDSTNVKLVLKK